MTIRGVTFDWWGTIAQIPPPSEAGALRALRIARLEERFQTTGIPFDRASIGSAYDRQGDLLETAWTAHREVDPQEQIEAFLRLADIESRDPRTIDAVAESFGGAILLRPPALSPHAAETLERLDGLGIAIGLISNTGRTWGRYLTPLQEALGIGRFFRARTYSDEHRIRKPDPRIFRAALASLGLPPEEVVHIGDDVVADIAGAKEVGMGAVWFDTGFWRGASTDRADATIRDMREFPPALGTIR